ncbi:heat shock factor-binding protein 1-like protein 1 isoform X1 [Strigops habroptila]|uniref:heat shock factor-binding protein 1-like protein 1 isoform X1 n=1 Tax=Strigops habroptila TaxID=2489341 RepID=UPI0011CF4CEB|nr:heat shock factor-binding protein 1-like protein 1 isoform X1 [Strigops habroptila]
MAAADPPGAGDLSELAENLLYQLQENFQALTEKITLRNILFRAGLLSPAGWVSRSYGCGFPPRPGLVPPLHADVKRSLAF